MANQARITSEVLSALKSQHGLKAIYTIGFNHAVLMTSPANVSLGMATENINFDEDYPSLDFAFKKVGFDVLAASAAIGQDNPLRAIKMQMESCLLWGDKDALFDTNDATVFTSVMEQFVKISSSQTASLKKN